MTWEAWAWAPEPGGQPVSRARPLFLLLGTEAAVFVNK